MSDRSSLSDSNNQSSDDIQVSDETLSSSREATIVEPIITPLLEELGTSNSSSSTSTSNNTPSMSGSGAGGGGGSVTVSPPFFGKSCRSADEILQRRVVCPKASRGLAGSKERDKHYTNATYALQEKFGALKHFVPKSKEGESEAYKYSDTQKEYVGNREKLVNFERRAFSYDMLGVLLVPKLLDSSVGLDQGRWDMNNISTTGINLLNHHDKIEMDTVVLWQQDVLQWANDAEDVTSTEWLLQLLRNSSEQALIARLDKKHDKLPVLQQGGITYLKLALDEMFTMSPGIVSSLQDELKKFGREGLAQFPDQNVGLCVIELDAIIDRLAEVDDLPRDTPLWILKGLCKCDVEEFVKPFNLLLATAQLAQAQNKKSDLSATETLQLAKEHTALATDLFNTLNISKEFNIPGGGGRVSICYNCEKNDGHIAPQCPEPRDEAKVKRNREAAAAARRNSGGGRGGAGRGGGGAGRGGGGRGRGRGNRKKWGEDPNKNGSRETNGVEKRGNHWMMWCKKGCDWNHTHTSGYHSAFKREGASFCLPREHDFWKMSGKTPPAASNGGGGGGGQSANAGGGAASSNANDSQLRSALSGIVDRHMSVTENADIASLCADLKQALN